MSNIFDYMADYCEQRKFRLTRVRNKFQLVWVVNGHVRIADFEDWAEVKQLVDTRDGLERNYTSYVRS